MENSKSLWIIRIKNDPNVYYSVGENMDEAYNNVICSFSSLANPNDYSRQVAIKIGEVCNGCTNVFIKKIYSK